MSRSLAFFLGMLFGIIFLVGGICLAGYVAVAVVKPAEVVPESSTYIGNLADMTILDIVQELQSLYNQKVGFVDENGRYFSLGEFCEKYEIDINSAFGVGLPPEVLDVPVFEFFSEGGMDRALGQVKVSSIPAVMNMFGESAFLSQDTVDELSKYSLRDLLDEEKGIGYVFQNIKMVDVLPDSFPAEDSANKLMWAIGQSSIGKLVNAFGDSNSLFTQIKEGGALEVLGTVTITDLLGGSTDTLATLLGDTTLINIVDENGAVNIDGILYSVRLGGILGCMRNELSIEDYTKVKSDDNYTLYSKTQGDTTLYILSDGTKHYEAELDCSKSHTEHDDVSCYSCVWYNQQALPSEHEHSDNELVIDGVHHARVTGLYQVLTNLSFSDLSNGSADAILDKVMDIKLGELLNGEISGIMSNFENMTINELMNGGIDDLYLGNLFNYERTAAEKPATSVELTEGTWIFVDASGIIMSDNNSDWFEAKLTCTDDHSHGRGCYSYIWSDGSENPNSLMMKLADKKIGELNDLDSTIQSLTLREVLGDDGVTDGIFKTLADVQVGNISEEINKMYLGTIFGYVRNQVEATGYSSIENTTLWSKTVGETKLFAIADGSELFEATLTCAESHTHTADCYNFVWYSNDESHSPVSGIYKALVNLTFAELTNGSSTAIMKQVKSLTLSEFMGEDEIAGVLVNFADVTISELMNGAVETLYLGDFFKYERTEVAKPETSATTLTDGTLIFVDASGIIMSDNGKKWYTAKQTCTIATDHSHSRSCYSYIWSDGSENPNSVLLKLADKKVSQLNDLDQTIQSLTLSDVLGRETLSNMLLELADVPISDISTEINNLYLGSAMNYIRNQMDKDGYTIVDGCTNVMEKDGNLIKSDDGKVWYEAECDCNSTHAHTDDCYVFVWYVVDNVKVTGITKGFVNSKLNDIEQTMNNITLRKLGISGNNILDAMQDIPLSNLSEASNNLKFGVVLGYHQETEDGPWLTEEDSEVVGLNAKLSNKTLGQLHNGTAITEVAESLTIGDIIDSGMMTLLEEDEYKLDIIYCDDTATFTDERTVTMGGSPYPVSQTYGCNIADFLQYKIYYPSCTAKEYYLKFDEVHSETCECRGKWKDEKLSDFISKMLGSI